MFIGLGMPITRPGGVASESFGAEVWPQVDFDADTNLEFDSNDPPVVAGGKLTFQAGEAGEVYCRSANVPAAGLYRYEITIDSSDPSGFVLKNDGGSDLVTFDAPGSLSGNVSLNGTTKVGLYDVFDRSGAVVDRLSLRPIL